MKKWDGFGHPHKLLEWLVTPILVRWGTLTTLLAKLGWFGHPQRI